MDLANTNNADDLGLPRGTNNARIDHTDSSRRAGSAVAWGAIAAGAAAAASLSLILLILGVGLGLSSVSPWARDGASAVAMGISTIVWLTFTQLVASGLGGYLAGRLRTKWSDVLSDEVYFRDTAHGFLAWAVASLATAALLTSVIGSIVSGGAQAGAQMVGGAAQVTSAAVNNVAASAGMTPGASEGGPMGYFLDALFRRDPAAPTDVAAAFGAVDVNARTSHEDAAEVGRIFLNVRQAEPLPADDLRHVGVIVSQRTGLSQPDAEKRVTEVYAKVQAQFREAEMTARSAADKARKATASSALWLFVSLLVGAFVASLAATFGGRQRDA